ncbi:hypothetical protein CkaCkLH20_08728 [Colletotrichum karsti]|uniref:Uncharacterized protein n=1 Tax=Colletotrichum karsti TaxID=1095194 RepID=A0A9P6HZ99_9PEZI|nr:uncharacterized protein CkaCkLH20_08728 [Colletotrichum karsti]KAF9873618.1 hypothetical protein CkaCkLH20_08728 [Colletotrichum karsti]
MAVFSSLYQLVANPTYSHYGRQPTATAQGRRKTVPAIEPPSYEGIIGHWFDKEGRVWIRIRDGKADPDLDEVYDLSEEYMRVYLCSTLEKYWTSFPDCHRPKNLPQRRRSRRLAGWLRCFTDGPPVPKKVKTPKLPANQVQQEMQQGQNQKNKRESNFFRRRHRVPGETPRQSDEQKKHQNDGEHPAQTSASPKPKGQEIENQDSSEGRPRMPPAA